jgi:predicted secreted protein
MIAGFNRGHNGLQQATRICAPAARVATHRDLEAGAKISLDRTARDANELASQRLGVSC